MNSVQQQCEHHHYKVLIESFHLSGQALDFVGERQDLEDLSVSFVKFAFGSKRVNVKPILKKDDFIETIYHRIR